MSLHLMNNDNEEKLKAIIQLWKELGVSRANYEFSCGGDSMGDTELMFYDNNGDEITNGELERYFEDSIYQNVDFYVNSDGYYQGESGNVEITLNDEENEFDYSKSSQIEYTETISSMTTVELNDDEIAFIMEKVHNINGSDSGLVINYKGDCMLTDEEEEIIQSIEEKFEKTLSAFEPETDSYLNEMYSFTTNPDEEELKIEGNKVLVQISNNVTGYREE